MAITKITKDMAIIAALADLPNATDGLSASTLKAKFDEGGSALKTYINDTLIPALQAITDNASGSDQIGATAITNLDGETVQAVLESIRNKLKSVTDNASGADFVGATSVSGLTGTTVQSLIESLKGYADTLDGQNVKKTGAQTVTGVKTFNDSPIVPTPTTDLQTSTKKYVDDKDTARGVTTAVAYVTKDNLANTRKLDSVGNFTGSWFGFNSPSASEPGIQSQVDANTATAVEVAKINSYQSLEITKLRMELVLTQLNSIGFYDLFDTLDDVNIPYTNATVDTTALDVTFLSEIYNLTVVSDVTSSTAVTTRETATIGDKIDDTNEITGVVEGAVYYDIASGSYDSVSFSVTSQDTNPQSISFNNDGSKLFMIGGANDTIYQYSLPTPFILTGMSYDSVSSSVASQDTSPRSIAFNNDGTKLFMLGDTSDTIYQYSLPTPFILTGMSYDSVSFSVTSQDTNPYSIVFNNDGTKLFMVGIANDTIYQYSLPTPFILTGMSYDSVSFGVGGEDTIPLSIKFNNDGTKLFMLGSSSDTIYQYSLPTPFILTGMSYDSVSSSVASQDTSPRSIAFNNDGTKLFMLGSSSDTIYQYTTGGTFFYLTLTSPITVLANDILVVYPSAYPYDTLVMDSQQFAVTAGNALVKLYTRELNNELDLKYQVFVNGVECSLIETLDYELTYELLNVGSNTVLLKVNGKDGVVLDNLLVAIS